MAREPFTKIVRLGSIPRDSSETSWVNVFAEIEWTGDRLSITGVEGPYHHGNAWGGCGQIVMSYRTPDERAVLRPNEHGWDADMRDRFFDLWDRWHLNDMTAGSPAQEEYIRANPEKFAVTYPVSHYENACAVLAEAGLNPDPNHDDYRYGSSWLREDVPDDVLDFFAGLPDTDKEPAWV